MVYIYEIHFFRSHNNNVEYRRFFFFFFRSIASNIFYELHLYETTTYYKKFIWPTKCLERKTIKYISLCKLNMQQNTINYTINVDRNKNKI